MTLPEPQKKRIRLAVGGIISLLLCISAVLLAIGCLSIYRAAEAQMFTYERIGKAFAKIAPVLYLTLLAVLVGAVIHLVFPIESKKQPAHRSIRATHASLSARVPLASVPEEQKKQLFVLQKRRRLLLVGNVILFVLSATLPMIYLLNPNRYLGTTSQECTAEVLRCLLVYAASLLPVTVYQLFYLWQTSAALTRETELFKEWIRTYGSISPAPQNESVFQKKEIGITWGIRIAALAAAVALIVLGIANDGMADVLKKAAEICAECIGLG